MHLILFNDTYVSFSRYKMSFEEMLDYNTNIILHLGISFYIIKHTNYTHFVRNR